jgi:hypothetical protein
MILHYKESGERFRNFFLAYPLSTDSRITHYLIFTTHVGRVVGAGGVHGNAAPLAGSEQQAGVIGPNFAQQNYLAQNLQANFNAAKQSAAAAAGASPTGLASTQQPQNQFASLPVMLPSMTASSDSTINQSTVVTQQQFPLLNTSLKRTHGADSNGSIEDMESSRKIAKTINDSGSN